MTEKEINSHRWIDMIEKRDTVIEKEIYRVTEDID